MGETMKAAQLVEIGKIELHEVPKPELKQPDEVLIKIKAVGVCGSDVHFFEWGRIGDFVVEFPFTLGHEAAGEVVAVGPEVTNVEPGDLVAIEPGVPCRKCELCRRGLYNLCPDVVFLAAPPVPGAYCEYLVWPSDYVFKLPPKMTVEEGAMMEPLNVGMYGASRAPVLPGQTVVVTGAGPIGLMALQSAKAFGAAKVIVSDPVETRLGFASNLGADVTLNPTKPDFEKHLRTEVGPLGADVVLECSGSIQAIQQIAFFIKPGGALVSVGIFPEDSFALPIWHLQSREIDFKGIFRYRNMYPPAIALTASGKIDVKSMISKRFPLEKTQEALEFSAREKEAAIKTVILLD